MPSDGDSTITGRPGSAEPAFASLELLQRSGVAFEVRTTWHPALLPPADMLSLAETLARQNVPTWAIQPFRPKGCPDETLRATGPAVFPDDLLTAIRQKAPGLEITIRG